MKSMQQLRKHVQISKAIEILVINGYSKQHLNEAACETKLALLYLY